ncbi:MAG: hypothetical protein IKO89_03375 [Bacteroidales bacterium]|nr:hypothetical protein [Bacteroidales bacterium]
MKKSGGASVKNGELSEDVRNVLSTSSFSPFSERAPILAGICTAAKRISFRLFSLGASKENRQQPAKTNLKTGCINAAF